MKQVSFVAAVAAAAGILVLSCAALVLGIGGPAAWPQSPGWGFRLVTAGYLLQAIGSVMVLMRLVAWRLSNAPDRGTGQPPAD